MSWEESTLDRICQCGKGKIKVISKMDDWSRLYITEIILCEDCKEKDVKEKEYQNKREIEFNEQEETVLTYFNKNYLEKWLNYIENMKNKKAIWKVTSEARIERCGESTFYSHWRCFQYTKRDYAKKLVAIDTIPEIMVVLRNEDKKLNDMLKEPLEYLNEKKTKDLNEAYARI